jgi:hypothetical protein
MFDENDIIVVKHAGPTFWRPVVAVATAMPPGTPLKVNAAAALALATGDPEIGTDVFLGIAQNTSTHTSALAGVVNIISMIPMLTVLRWHAQTSSNINTAAKIAALVNDWYTCDLTGTVYTIDENDADAPTTN